VYLRVHPKNPEDRKIAQVVEALKNGALIIYPTDTVYAIGCDIFNTKAVERLYKLKGVTEKTAKFSFICETISDLSKYAKSIDNAVFRDIKKCLPGPYTFIFEASKEVPKVLKTKKNTVGMRISENLICMALVQALGNPIITTSLPESDMIEDYTDPEIFVDYFENKVDIIIDGGIGNSEASTVIDYTTNTPVLIRKGLGSIEHFDF
jgi:tRNA threonylcarbamoyl adenosine modification protein (Sua5/YciO/YrdC/YwlC family)